MHYLPLLSAGSLASLAQAASVPLFPRGSNSTEEFSWVSTRPTRDLKYHDCYDGFQCARLEVPLDWSNPTGNLTAAIAIVKLPATVPDDDPSFGGSVLVNPGGPGGSGTLTVQTLGAYAQTILGGERNYEIIGFDPRGVNLSTPHGDCYKGDELTRTLDQERATGFGLLREDTEAMRYSYAHAVGVGELCEQDGVDSIWGHMSTASVARDMVEIVDRIDELRWKKSNATKPDDAEKPRVQYIGFSYGSYLGSVFASMFPERVGRFLIDAILDPVDWSQAIGRQNLNDMEAAIDYFYEICFNSGEGCPLLQPTDNGPSDIKARVEDFIKELDKQPISFSSENNRAEFITSRLVRELLAGSAYSPFSQFEPLAKILASLLAGNYDFWSQLNVPPIRLECDNAPNATEVPAYSWNRETLLGVLCSDHVETTRDRNVSDYGEIIGFLEEQSPIAGPYWSSIIIGCAGRKIVSPYSFTGPFGSPAPDPEDPNAPAAPLLIVSSRIDPVTPLENAFTVQKQHPGSAVLIQESYGHTFMSAPSACTIRIIREYFLSGKVPESGTVCEADCVPTIPASDNECNSTLFARDVNHPGMPPALKWQYL